MSRIIEDMRGRLITVSRALWITGLAVAMPHFFFNAFIVFTSNYCCGSPWDDVQWMPLIVIFVIAMIITLGGLSMRRIIAQPSQAQHVLWAAAAIGWCGVLSFGIGSAGSSFYVDSAFGGGAVTFYMQWLGILAVLTALAVAVFGFVAALAERVSASKERTR